jgi:hypothetical protein
VFLILVARAVAPVWEVQRSATGVICNLVQQKPYGWTRGASSGDWAG